MSEWIETFSGKRFHPTEPDPEMIDIIDIAHALSNKTRFSGHCRKFYSVAQHSLFVSQFSPPEYALEGLLHDAAEAYFPDIPRPVRKEFPDLMHIENAIHRAVAERFNLIYPWPMGVKTADDKMLVDEARDLMHSCGVGWAGEGWDVPRYGFGVLVRPTGPKETREAFIERYNEIIQSRDVSDPWHFKAIIKERKRQWTGMK